MATFVGSGSAGGSAVGGAEPLAASTAQPEAQQRPHHWCPCGSGSGTPERDHPSPSPSPYRGTTRVSLFVWLNLSLIGGRPSRLPRLLRLSRL